MADVYWNGSVNNTWDAAGNWEDFATAPYGSIPLHGDDVHFLGARLGANRCGVGPTAVVLLESISADLAYDAAVNATVCYANCGMVGRPVTTVTIDGDSYITGGIITTANLNHSTGAWGTSARASGATITTLNLTGDYTATTGAGAATMTTINCIGDYSRVAGNITSTTVTMTGQYNQVNVSGVTWPTITTLNCNGDNGQVVGATITTVNFNGDNCELQLSAARVVTTLYVYGDDCEVSLLGIAIPRVTNGPYMCGLDQVLYDYDSGLVIADLSQIPSYSEGRW